MWLHSLRIEALVPGECHCQNSSCPRCTERSAWCARPASSWSPFGTSTNQVNALKHASFAAGTVDAQGTFARLLVKVGVGSAGMTEQ